MSGPAALSVGPQSAAGLTPLLAMQQRIERNSIPEPNSGCWLWTGRLNTNGYGEFNTPDRKNLRAHRVSWECFNGKSAGDLFVCHKCDVRSCVNPLHLFLGTNKDNLDDMVRKGRNKYPRLFGPQSPVTKLSTAQALEIYYSTDPIQAAGKRFGVSPGCVKKIRRGERWVRLLESSTEQ